MFPTLPSLFLAFHSHIELGLYTTDFGGPFSVSNNLFGCAVVRKKKKEKAE